MASAVKDRDAPFAVIDLGSNTVRVVVFERQARVPVALVNERVFSGLGRGVGTSGRLDEAQIVPLMECLGRFVSLAASLGAPRVTVLATSAVRDAANGPDLVARIRSRWPAEVVVLSGEEEARISAEGVISGMPEADGIVGDLGGGSLELTEVADKGTGRTVSLPLGPLRLAETSRGDLATAMREVGDRLKRVDWLEAGRDRDLYAVGGSWRALAQVHIDQSDYPIHMVHGYALARKDAANFASVVRGLGPQSLERIQSIPERRRELLPLGAAVLAELVSRIKPARVVFSAAGLREGFLFSRLDAKERDKDPLLVACEALAAREARDPALGARIEPWSRPLFPGETAREARVRRAACILSDIGWREHPDYRAPQIFRRMLHHPFLGLDHRDRVTLAIALFVRLGGKLGSAAQLDPATGLLDETGKNRALAIGSALRLAYAVSGGAADILAESELRVQGKRVELVLSGKALPEGPQVAKSFRQLLRAIKSDGRILEAKPATV
jgi:exopolyphosphatase / guanosine-5'-triphosphate,3'-diphosphate pyrophosphatase